MLDLFIIERIYKHKHDGNTDEQGQSVANVAGNKRSIFFWLTRVACFSLVFEMLFFCSTFLNIFFYLMAILTMKKWYFFKGLIFFFACFQWVVRVFFIARVGNIGDKSGKSRRSRRDGLSWLILNQMLSIKSTLLCTKT